MNSHQRGALTAIFETPIRADEVTDKGAVKSVREFLVQAGVTP